MSEAAIPLREGAPRPARAILREFLEEVIEGEDEIHLAQLVEAARVRFRDDDEMHRALVNDALAFLVGDVLHAIVGEQRRLHPEDAAVETESGFVSRRRVDLRAKEIAARIFESVGDGRRKSLLAMTRADLDAAIGTRDRMLRGLARYNGFLRDLRVGLRNDRQTVGERYSSQQFERLWHKHFDVPGRDQLPLG